MANANHSQSSRLLTAVREAQDHGLRLTDANEHARARARLLQAMDRVDAGSSAAAPTSPARGAGWRWGLGTMAAAACAAALWFAMPGQDSQVLGFQVDGAQVSSNQLNQMITAGEHSRVLAFSDGTSVELAPGGRMYIDNLRSNGATVVLETGEVGLAVHHEDDTSWQVAAGPWTVHVTGTQFDVAWEPVAQSFRVAVTEGSVRVEGPEGEIADLRSGDTLIRERGKATIEPETLEADPTELALHNLSPGSNLNTPDAKVDGDALAQAQLDELSPDPDPDPDPSVAEGEGEVGEVSPTKTKPTQAEQTGWGEHFDNSKYAEAWDTLAELPGGIHGEAKRADAGMLLDLADVARYTKHRDDSRKLLERLRERYPSSDEAGEAAFALGRLAANGGSQAKAATWFELYLGERPKGSLAGDARGRLMDAYDALGRTDDASSAASRYLEQFPNGPHAGKAQKILAR